MATTGSPYSDDTANLAAVTLDVADAAKRIKRELPASSVGEWLRLVRARPLQQWTAGDCAVALRQRIHPMLVARRALVLLEASPWVGDLYDGELLSAFASLRSEDWTSQGDTKKRLSALCEKLLREGALQPPPVGDSQQWRQLANEIRAVFTTAMKRAPREPVLQFMVGDDEDSLQEFVVAGALPLSVGHGPDVSVCLDRQLSGLARVHAEFDYALAPNEGADASGLLLRLLGGHTAQLNGEAVRDHARFSWRDTLVMGQVRIRFLAFSVPPGAR